VANLTLVIDDEVLKRARIRALEQGTSVNAMVRDYLAGIAGESDARQAMIEFLAIVKAAGAGSGEGGRSWTRDELYDID
jgi:plasmid stability protein